MRHTPYLPEDVQVRGVAAGTGVAGVYMERGFFGLAAGAVALPYAVALALAASETAAAGVVVNGFRTVGTQMVKQFTWKAFKRKVGSDFAVQFSSSMVKHSGNVRAALGDVSATSLLTSWLLPASDGEALCAMPC